MLWKLKYAKIVGKRNLLLIFKSIRDIRMVMPIVARSAEICIIKVTTEQLEKKIDRREEIWQIFLQERFFLN